MVKNKVKVKFRGKIVSAILLVCIVLFFAISSIAYFQVSSLVKDNVKKQLDSNTQLGFRLLNDSLQGEWKVDGDKLYKGDTLLNDNYKFVDAIKSETGSIATIFLADTRISTNVESEGKRATGTKMSSSVANKVLKEGSSFEGEATVVNKLYEAKYMPIKDKEGKVIGAWFVGVEKSKVESDIKVIMLKMILAGMVALAFGATIAIFVAKGLSKNIKEIDDFLDNIAEGDFTKEIKLNSNDETGEIADKLNETLLKIKELIVSIKGTNEKLNSSSEELSSISKEMSSASENVSSSITDVANGTGSQAEDLVKIAEIIVGFGEELSKIVQSISEIEKNSKSINSLALDSSDDMKSLMGSVEKVDESFSLFSKKIVSFDKEINRINEVTELINSIADQTNLLALNASIEAARAGEAGRGFAVVAEEIRKLAEQSKESSGNINQLIFNISSETNIIVNSTTEMKEEINSQISVINETVNSYKNIILAIEEVIPKIVEVNKSASNIDTEKNAIVEKIESASSVAEEVYASSEEISASSEQLSAAASEVAETAVNLTGVTKEMKEKVEFFKFE